ncbi:MAG: methyltransferase domain-containing protein [Alphaproteobacteria bacterium]|jgi:SAM-dependent methyltransferase
MSLVHSLARVFLPESAHTRITALRRKHRLQWPRAGSIEFGDFNRLTPVSAIFGFDRGQAIDRYYIEAFLKENAADITGRCLELGDPFYIEKFGKDVSQADVLHYVEGNPQATIVGDLTDAPHIPDNSFDCIIFTQTIQMIYEPAAAFQTLHRILKPGGVALITSAGIAKIGRRLGRDPWGEYWHFTAQSLEKMALAVLGTRRRAHHHLWQCDERLQFSARTCGGGAVARTSRHTRRGFRGHRCRPAAKRGGLTANPKRQCFTGHD